MITFHKLTQLQYEKMLTLSGQVTDGLYFLTDVGVIKLHNGGESVTTFGTSVKTVSGSFPDANNVQMYCIYSDVYTKEQRMWDGSQWQILSYPITNQITSGIALSSVTTVPNTYAVYNFVQDRVAAAELGVHVRLHPPVFSIQDLQNLPISSTTDGTILIEDKCMILVQSNGLYRYDKEARDIDDPNTDSVVTPQQVLDSVPEGDDIRFYKGRWIKMFDNLGYIAGDGVVITGNNFDTNQIVKLNVNTEQFTFDEQGRLTINSGADFVGQKVDKVYGVADQIATWRVDGNQDGSGYSINKTGRLTNSLSTISPDAVVSTFVHEITDKKLDDVRADSDGKIIVGKGNNGKVDASFYDIGTDNDNFHGHVNQNIPANRVATEKAVKWYVDRSLSFNKEDNLAETVDGIPPTELGD